MAEQLREQIFSVGEELWKWQYSLKNQVLSTLLSCSSSWVTELFQDLWDPLPPTSSEEEKDIFGITPLFWKST